MSQHFDFLIVGTGFAGSVLTERIASQTGKTCHRVDFVLFGREHWPAILLNLQY